MDISNYCQLQVQKKDNLMLEILYLSDCDTLAPQSGAIKPNVLRYLRENRKYMYRGDDYRVTYCDKRGKYIETYNNFKYISYSKNMKPNYVHKFWSNNLSFYNIDKPEYIIHSKDTFIRKLPF